MLANIFGYFLGIYAAKHNIAYILGDYYIEKMKNQLVYLRKK